MPDLPTRNRHEEELALALAAMWGEQRRRLLLLLGNPPSVDHIPEKEWERIRKETQEALRGSLAIVYFLAVQNLKVRLPQFASHYILAQAAVEWATNRSATLAEEMTANTQQRLRESIERARGFTAATQAEVAAEVRQSMGSILGPARAETVGVTETTGAITAGERRGIDWVDEHLAKEHQREAARAEAEGRKPPKRPEKTVAVWVTEADSKVCPICRPLNGRRMDEWDNHVAPEIAQQLSQTGGPPAHVNCRCWVEWRIPEWLLN